MCSNFCLPRLVEGSSRVALLACHRRRRQLGAGLPFGPWGFAWRLRDCCGRGALVASFPFVRVQSHDACQVALRAVGCCVLLCFRCSGARWVLPAVAVARCFGPCLCASLLCCWSALMGRLSVLECAVCGFPLLLVLLHLFPPLRPLKHELKGSSRC